MFTTSLPKEIREKIADHLNELVAICKDGEAGYRDAAEETKSPELQTLFSRLARQRADFVIELQRAVTALDCEPRDSSHLAGKLHRGWINLKAAIVSNDAHAVLAECERGEDAAVAAYAKALKEAPLDTHQRALVDAQSQAVKAAHDQIRDLRDHPAYAGEKS